MNTQFLSSRELILYLSLLYEGDWERIYSHLQNKDPIDEDDAIKRIKKVKSKYITIIDEEYPVYLKSIFRPPFVLYYYGDISLIKSMMKNVAIVGSRECDGYGISSTTKIAKELSKDYVIVSGLARGVDAFAHQAAIDAKGRTVAVLGCGIEKCYPAKNLELYNIIKKDHLLLSEYPGTVTPDQKHFPFRNRLIAGLSCVTVVTQAKHHSGTQITVFFALEMGRAVCAVPHHIDEDSLCNTLISEGARILLDPRDVIEEIEVHYSGLKS